MIGIDCRQYLRSRLAWFYMTGRWPTHQIDHIDLNPRNDRLKNLREATQNQNQVNTRVYRNNKIGLKGVHLSNGKWRAIISRDGKNRHIGTFENPEAAHQAYLAEAKSYWGEFVPAENLACVADEDRHSVGFCA